jgi:LPPG:FO 2-phospho-L-lactate transferase
LNIQASNASIARHYMEIIDGLVIDSGDGSEAASLPVASLTTATLMNSLDDRVTLARDVLDFARELASSPQRVRPRYSAG